MDKLLVFTDGEVPRVDEVGMADDDEFYEIVFLDELATVPMEVHRAIMQIVEERQRAVFALGYNAIHQIPPR